MLFFWYCFDDALASALGNPGIGAIPWWVILLAHLPLMTFGASRS